MYIYIYFDDGSNASSVHTNNYNFYCLMCVSVCVYTCHVSVHRSEIKSQAWVLSTWLLVVMLGRRASIQQPGLSSYFKLGKTYQCYKSLKLVSKCHFQVNVVLTELTQLLSLGVEQWLHRVLPKQAYELVITSHDSILVIRECIALVQCLSTLITHFRRADNSLLLSNLDKNPSGSRMSLHILICGTKHIQGPQRLKHNTLNSGP